MELRGAAFSWGVEKESVRDCRVRRNEAKGRGGGRLGGIYRGRGVGATFFDWPRWVAAHLIVGVVGRQGLQEKEVGVKKFQLMHAKSLAWPAISS